MDVTDSVDKAQEYIPGGAVLHLETIWHHRWRIHMPHKPERPWSKSKSFGEKKEKGTKGKADDEKVLTSREAFLYVLKWSWDVHQVLTGESCLHDLACVDATA